MVVIEVVKVVGAVVAEAGMVRRVECVRSIPFLVMIRGVFLIGKWPSTGLEGWREGSEGRAVEEARGSGIERALHVAMSQGETRGARRRWAVACQWPVRAERECVREVVVGSSFE